MQPSEHPHQLAQRRRNAGSCEAVPRPGRPDARNPGANAEHAGHIVGDARGLPVSLSRLLQDQLVQGQIGDRSLEAGILLLELLQPPGLIDLEPAVLPAPTIVTLLRYSDALTDLADRLSLSQVHRGFSQVVDDLLDRIPLSRHLFLPFSQGTRCRNL